MSARAPEAADTISDVKVTEHAKPFAVRITWLDTAGARRTATRFGRAAQQLATDLQAAAVIGDPARRYFLVGFIRGLADRGGIDEGLRPPTW